MICLRPLLLHHQHASMLLLRRVKLWKQRRRSVTNSLDSGHTTDDRARPGPACAKHFNHAHLPIVLIFARIRSSPPASPFKDQCSSIAARSRAGHSTRIIRRTQKNQLDLNGLDICLLGGHDAMTMEQ